MEILVFCFEVFYFSSQEHKTFVKVAFFVFTYGEEGTTTLVFFLILTWVGPMVPSLFGVIPCLLVYPQNLRRTSK
jgi:hypothetical protein